MDSFLNFRDSYPGVDSERDLRDSEFYYVLELLDDLPFQDLFYLTCVEDDDNFELFNFIEANGIQGEEFDNLQLYDFDDKNVVLYNAFGETIIFCKRSDVTELSEVF
jgi:hypothetical protein